MICSGTQYFYKTVIEKLKTTFKIGSESLNLNIKQNTDFSIDVDQTNYIDKSSYVNK